MKHFPGEVAVILPTFNGERFIQQQIESILNQTFSQFQLFVFDDGSSDKTVEIVDNLIRTDPRIHLTVNSGRKGIKRNISDALDHVKADIYFLSDQDDIWQPQKMQVQLDVLEQEGVVMTFTNLSLINEMSDPMGKSVWESSKIKPEMASRFDLLITHSIVTGCTMAFKKSVPGAALPIPKEAPMHDHWLSLFAAYLGAVVPVNMELVGYRQHTDNLIGAKVGATGRWQFHYSGCDKYVDFRERKQQKIFETAAFIQVLKARFQNRGEKCDVLERYFRFYNSLISKSWLSAFVESIQLSKVTGSAKEFKTLMVLLLFPVVFLAIKTGQWISGQTTAD